MTATFKFTPSPKAFPGSVLLRTVKVDQAEGLADLLNGAVTINDKPMSGVVLVHAMHFGLKQRLANSYASAGTAKNEAGGLLSLSEREALWQSSFDKVFAKMVEGKAVDWSSVWSESTGREPVDPIEREIARIVRAKLEAWAKKSEKTLPKAASPEYAGLVAKLLAKQGDAIRAEAARRVAEVDDLDIGDLDDLETEAAE